MTFYRRSITRALILSALIGLLVGAGGFTFYYAHGTAYLSNDPRACANCHIMRDQFDSWQKSSHHAVATCNDCHTPHALIPKYLTKADNGFWHSYKFTFQNFHEPIQIRPRNRRVLEHNCLYCHEQLVDEIVGHQVDAPGELDCIHCHASVGHGPVR